MRTGSSCRVRQKALKKSTSTHFDGYQSQPVRSAHPTNYQISSIFGSKPSSAHTLTGLELNNLQSLLFLWDGRPARSLWTGGTPIPQTCVNYLICDLKHIYLSCDRGQPSPTSISNPKSPDRPQRRLRLLSRTNGCYNRER